MNALETRDSTADPMAVGVLPFQNPQYLGIDWDAENRLLAINQGTLRSEFTYDGRGARVRIVEKQNGGVTSDKRFVWCRGRICEERSPDGSTVNRRFFGQGMQESSASFLYTHDHLGNVREMTDSNASATTRARYDYEPYGERSLVGGDKDTPFGFTGHYMHDVSGLALTLFRAYDPNSGRWLSEDPIRLSAGSPNFYAYLDNMPLNLVDPLGLMAGGAYPDMNKDLGWPHCDVPPCIKNCLEQQFNEKVDDVVVIEDPVLSALGYAATTRAGDRNYKIYIGMSCADFWKSPATVLEEYAHIQRQWKKGRMDALSYAILFAIYGYDQHPDEIEAKRYRDKYWKQLDDCFRRCRDKC